MRRLDGKVAFVTGAGGAIGSAISRRFAEEGASVVCTDIANDSAARTVKDIIAAGGQAVSTYCDSSNAGDVKYAIDYGFKAFGRLDVLVTTAASNDPSASVVELDESDWSKAIAVNLTSVFLIAKYGIPKLVEAGGGSIVILASQLGRVVVPRRPAYVTTKAALIQLARALALDHAKEGIRVNSLSPGAIETVRVETRFADMEAARKALVPLHPIGRLGRPEDIANGALYLASDESSFMTGADLVIDGGYTCI